MGKGVKGAPLILAVDANRRNLELLTQFLGREGYRTHASASLEEFDQAIRSLQEIGLVLLDIAGFDHQIWERCERLRHSRIPFLVISPRQSAAIQQESLAHGARAVVVKPLMVGSLLGIIRRLLEEI
jgi:DNA-binding response OmpR family regulator